MSPAPRIACVDCGRPFLPRNKRIVTCDTCRAGYCEDVTISQRAFSGSNIPSSHNTQRETLRPSDWGDDE